MGISWHNPNTIDEFEAEVRQFLRGEIIKVSRDDPRNEFGAEICWIDENKVNTCVIGHSQAIYLSPENTTLLLLKWS